MENKIVIFSFTNIAKQIAKTLKMKNYHIIIIEEDEELAQNAKKSGYEVIQISLMNDDNIKSLHLDDSLIKGFFCLNNNKNTNLFVTLSVRHLYPKLKIISVSFASEDNKTISLAGADKIINPYEIGALRIFRLLHKPFILDVLDNILFSESNIEVSEITIKKNSLLDGVYLKDIQLIEKYNLILLGLQDKELSEKFIFYSSGINHKIDADDTLVVLGYSHDLKSFKLLLNNNHKQ